jgi:hypothetical protein
MPAIEAAANDIRIPASNQANFGSRARPPPSFGVAKHKRAAQKLKKPIICPRTPSITSAGPTDSIPTTRSLAMN